MNIEAELLECLKNQGLVHKNEENICSYNNLCLKILDHASNNFDKPEFKKIYISLDLECIDEVDSYYSLINQFIEATPKPGAYKEILLEYDSETKK